ncbi:hypothetical protein [Streptomyces sp. NBC_01142]|uniref:hypothetical protein n=1 Tax=Streptomyces sp. NBC_01142 TaxID=2975865 RepID=UPI002B1D52AF|nr:hypothetical protein [Streptomyces sp. NBC_01142]
MRQALHRRTLAAIGAAGAAVVGVAACEPSAADGVSAVAVAITTDKTATSTLERLDFDVRWLSCTATLKVGAKASKSASGTGSSGTGSSGTGSTSPSGRSVATVDCQGETGSGQEITLTGNVTEERSGRCVRGDLIAKIDGKVVFRASVLGNCAAEPTHTSTHTSTRTPPYTPPVTHRPPTAPPGPTTTVTVTVTATTDPGHK